MLLFSPVLWNRIDGRYDVIGTGSLLGVKGYGKEPKSIPVGSETVIDMYPLDFEEFLWTNGVDSPVIEILKKLPLYMAFLLRAF